MLDVIILAGGLGTRLANTVPNLPKALAPIAKTPFLEILLKQLERSKIISNLVLALGYRSTDILNYIQARKNLFSIHTSIEKEPLGTGGALLSALPLTSSETILVMNGDSFFDLSLMSFLRFHQEKQSDLSIACREIEDASRYGIIKTDSSSRILSFQEKSEEKQAGLISTGIYLIERRILTHFPLRPCSLEKEIFSALLSCPDFAYPHHGTFIDIGTHASYFEAQDILKHWTLT